MRLADAAARTVSVVFITTALLLVEPPAGMAADLRAGEPELDQSEAQSRLGQVVEEITRLKQQLEARRTEQREEQARLRQLDLQIQNASRELRVLRDRELDHRQELAVLNDQRAEYLDRLNQRMDQLAEQLRWSYRDSRQSRIKLLLNQDDPAQVSRMLAYYEYYARAQTDRISMMHEALMKLEGMQQSIDAELAAVQGLVAEQSAVLDQLQAQRGQRRAMVAQLEEQIGDESARLAELERNRHDLEALIERLADVLADIPPDLSDHRGVAKQKGKLPMPVSGPVRRAFGQSRAGEIRWQGWLIGAEAGTDVVAIAHGRVAFADWLRGYGLLIIIDHGEGFMSLYGHNESLVRDAGAWVKPGEVIGIVGSNPGNGQGLYFELRKEGKAVDPAAWLAR